MEIEILTPARYNEYTDFLLRHKEALFYYSLKYKAFLKALLGCGEEYLVALEGGEIVGILPLLYLDGKYGRVYNSLPYYGSNGGIIASSKEVFRALVKKYNEIINKDGVASATIVANPLMDQNYPGLDYDLTDVRIGQFSSLLFKENSREELLTGIDSSARRNVRKAEELGVAVEIDNTLTKFLKETHQENMAAIGGKAKTEHFFNIFGKHFLPGEDYDIYAAKLDGDPISALLLFYFNVTVEYFTPVTKLDKRNIQPMAPILVRAMLDAHKKGFAWWNWGGTWLTQEGVLKFKRKWGAIDKEYTYYIKINNKELYESSKDEVLKEYPDFFVIPFNRLKS